MDPLKTFLVKSTNNLFEKVFRIGMEWRIFYGSLRLIFGLSLLRLIGTPLSDIFYTIMSHELIEDPADFIVQAVTPLLQHSSFTITYFLAGYLIFWGIIDILLSINLLKKRMWAFPVSIYLIGIFVLYEIYRFSHTHSRILAFIIIIDVILILIIRKEYNKLKTTTLDPSTESGFEYSDSETIKNRV